MISSKCSKRSDDKEIPGNELKSFTLYEATSKEGLKHIGFKPYNSEVFIVLCGAYEDHVAWNKIRHYKSFKPISGRIKVILED